MTIPLLQFNEVSELWPWWMIWTLGAFLLGSLLTWVFTRQEPVNTDGITRERDRYHTAATKWEKDYQGVKYQLDEAHKREADLRANLQRAEAEQQTLRYRVQTAEANLAAGARVIPEDTRGEDGIPDFVETFHSAPTRLSRTGDGYDGLFEPDNFQVIEGIGPRVNTLLLEAGYADWQALAGAEVEDLRRILQEAGNRFALSDPTNWPAQALLAATGDWEALIDYQKSTPTGRSTDLDLATESKFEKLAAKKLGFSSANPHDLKVIEGIGPKVEKLLKAAGLNTWNDLAAATPEALTAILAEAGDRYRLADPASWPAQAERAAAGEWQELSQLRHRLKDARR